jgi:transcriptional regulator with XRE-family HTH domain
MPRRPSPTDHLDAVREKMGTIPDHEVADLCGSTAAIVGRYRRRHGIPSYQGYKFVKGEKPPGKKSGGKKGGRRARRSKIDPFHDEVGKIPDRELAEKAGVSVEGVRMYRKRHSIALDPEARQQPGRRSKSASSDVAESPVAESPVAESGSAAPQAEPMRRKRRSKLDPFVSELGVMPDQELAEKAGVSLQAVRQYRRRHNISAPSREVAAPAAPAAVVSEPAAASAPISGEGWGYAVTVLRDNAEETCFLIAADIIDAARRAADANVGRVLGIRQLGPALQ